MVLHQAFRAKHVRTNGIGGEVRHGVTSGVSRETSSNTHVAPHLHRECIRAKTNQAPARLRACRPWFGRR